MRAELCELPCGRLLPMKERPKLTCQVIREGSGKWIVWKLGSAFKAFDGEGRDYEPVSRIIEDGGLFYVEDAIWGADGVDHYDRRPRGWLTYDGAKMNAVTVQEKKGAAA